MCQDMQIKAAESGLVYILMKTHLKSFAVDIENRLVGIKVISVFIKMFTQ